MLHRPLAASVVALFSATVLVASCGEESLPADLAAAPPLAAQDVDGGAGLLPSGAVCSSHDQCESGSCRGHCCKSTCNWNCPVSDSPVCDANGDCTLLGAHHYNWCPQCGITGGSTYIGPCDPVNGPEPCPIAPNGTSCSQVPWQIATCQDGFCVQQWLPLGSPCEAPGQCASSACADGVCCDTACPGPFRACTVAHGATADGVCTDVAGAACDDGDACTEGDAMVNGACVGAPVVCPLPNECHDAAGCDPQSGCAYAPKTDGTPCATGVCVSSACTTPSNGTGGSGGGSSTASSSSSSTTASSSTSTSTGAGGSGGSSSSSSTGSPAQPPPSGASCATSRSPSTAWPWAALLALATLRLRRRASRG